MDDKVYFLALMSFEHIVAFAAQVGHPIQDRRWRVPAIADHLARKRSLGLDSIIDALDGAELAAACRPLGVAAGTPEVMRDQLRAALDGSSVRAVRRAALARLKSEFEVLPAQLVRVIDGDTIDVDCQGVGYRVRLRGIDAPEAAESDKAEADIDRANIPLEQMSAMGVASAAWLQDRLAGRALFLHAELTPLGPQKYLHHHQHRLLAYLSLDTPDGEDVGEAMLREGYALVWPRNLKTRRYGHARNDQYVVACNSALVGRPGLWQGELARMCPNGARAGGAWPVASCRDCCAMSREGR